MKRMNLKKNAALALAAVTIAGSIIVPTSNVQAAGKSTVYVVTERQSDEGGKTKYSYNKNGLLTKEVFSDSYKSKGEELSESSTTKYKYNKKNRITSKTSESSSKTEEFYTDNYGERRPNKEGKISTVSTSKSNSTTDYTYDKKGKVTKTVTTSYNTYIPEGRTETETSKVDRYISQRYQKDANGNYVYDDDGYRIQVAGTGEYVNADKTVTTTTTYTDNGNGTITKVTTTETTSLDDENSTATNLVYVKNTVSVSETTTNQKVTTTTYTYDKKKRVKKAVADIVKTSSVVATTNTTYNVGTAGQYSLTTADSKTSSTKTSRTTDTYAYNKKGKATKVVTIDEPEVSYVSERTSKNTWRQFQFDGSYKDVTDEYSNKETIENGSKTTVSTSPKTNDDGSVTATTTTKVVSYPSNTDTITTTYKYDKKGNIKSSKAKKVDTNNRAYTYTVTADGTEKIVYNQIPGKVYDANTNRQVDGLVDDEDSPVYTQKVTTSTATNSNEVELKKNTDRLTKAIGIEKNLAEGESKSSYDVRRVTYKVKAKKVSKSAASSVNKQQWIIQNGAFNGEAGL